VAGAEVAARSIEATIHTGRSQITTVEPAARAVEATVTAAELPDYVERVLTRFRKERETDERFATWAARASEEALS
jgi:sulfite reductase beta subunit-like hemoprotein